MGADRRKKKAERARRRAAWQARREGELPPCVYDAEQMRKWTAEAASRVSDSPDGGDVSDDGDELHLSREEAKAVVLSFARYRAGRGFTEAEAVAVIHAAQITKSAWGVLQAVIGSDRLFISGVGPDGDVVFTDTPEADQ